MRDDLEDEINSLTETQEKRVYQKDKKFKTSTYGRASKDINTVQKFLWQFLAAIVWILNTFLKPFFFWLAGPVSWLVSKYIILWNKVVYVKDEYGLPVFSKVRGGFFIIASFVFGWYLFIPTIAFVADTSVYFTTVRRNEMIYLNGSQELNFNDGTHAVEGCSKLPCSDADSLYFRTNPSIFNDIWSIWNRGYPYYPDQVASGVPNDICECKITAYGIRFRWFNHNVSYPTLLGYTCKPVLGATNKSLGPEVTK